MAMIRRRKIRYPSPVTTRLSPERLRQLVAIADREGLVVSEAARIAIERWLDEEAAQEAHAAG